MPKIENTHINPHGFREYDARWLYHKDINGQGIKDVGRGVGSQIILKTKNYSGWLVVEAEQDPKKANPLEYAIKGHKYLTETLKLSNIDIEKI